MSNREVRLQKFLSRAGVASRRASEELILQGRVRVNGERVTELGSRMDPARDRVEVDGKEVRTGPLRFIILNKPRGVVTTRDDPQGRPTVFSLLEPVDPSLRYVGRLDQDTEGLLLLTNDGDLLHALTHPSRELPREYRAMVGGVPGKDVVAALERGVELEDGLARAEQVRIVRTLEGGKGAVVSLVLREGRKREVRRLFDAVGHSIRQLRRVAFGPIRLERLRPGEWRELTRAEVDALRAAVTEGDAPSEGVRRGRRGKR